MTLVVVRLVVSAALLWRVWLGDRWALVLVLALMTLAHEALAYELSKRRRATDRTRLDDMRALI